MLKICHTADIHIRSLSRHDEYKEIFKAFIDDCALQKADHIFVGGDIFHTKTTGISPEYIDLLTWWLNSMSKVAEVHLVLGNHDGNLVNLSRQDAVSPIVEAMANPRVHLYKKSGVYPIEKGFNWCVFSCFDEEGWKDVKPIPGDVNIATFHGPVRGSITETGWDIDEGITADFFKDYDFCMLGDIHKPQNLDFRNGKPWIAYPGTPIQQNYAEQLEHGYLLWKITSRDEWDVETRSLPNIKPYVTIDWQGTSEQTIKVAFKHPKGSRFRIKSNVQLTQADTHVLSEALKTSMVATEVTYKSDFQIDKQTVSAGTATIQKTDLRSPDIILKFLTDYYKDVIFSIEDKESLNNLIRSYLKSSKIAEDAKDVKWSLRHLKWDNLFSYGENNQVNFEKLSGIVGIFGPNRTGKSSIVGTLMYTLFNTTDRGSIKNASVCNVRKQNCYARAVVDHNGVTYIVERQTAKISNRKGIVSAPTSLNLYKMKEDGDAEDLCGEQRIDTDKVLKSLFGQPEDFMMTSLSAQGEINQFIEQGSTKRRAILAKFLDLDVFDRLHDSASKEVTGYKAQLKNFPDRDWSTEERNNKNSLLECIQTLKQLDDKIIEERSNIESLKHELSKHNTTIVTQADIDRQVNKVKELKSLFKDSSQKADEMNDLIAQYQMKISALDKLMSENDINKLKVQLDAQRTLESSIKELKHLYDKENSTYAYQQKSLKILDEVPCGDEYPTCKFIKDAHEIKKQSALQKKKVANALEKLDEAQKSYEKIKQNNLQEKIEKCEKASSLRDKMTFEILKCEAELEKIQTSLKTQNQSLVEADRCLENLRMTLNNEENHEVVLIKQKIKELSESIDQLDAERLVIASKKGKLQSDMEKLALEKERRKELLHLVKFHDLISGAFSKKGIPLLITKSQLPIINTEISKILQGIVDFTIEMENDEITDSLEIYINYGDSRRVIELCSGMEKTLASLAIRIALVNISSLPKPDFFIIDEGFGTLDSSGVEACNRLLVSLKRHFKTIIVITHVDGIKDCADCVLEITKNEKDSKMEYV